MLTAVWLIFLASAPRCAFAAAASLGRDRIFFVHTSEERGLPSASALCSVESAARQNEDALVVVYSDGWSENMLREAVGGLENVRVELLEADTLFGKTVPNFGRWYHERSWETGYKYHHLSDAARLALLYAFGGTYMDFDVISVHSVAHLDSFICIEEMETPTTFRLNNAVMKFGERHDFVRGLIDDFVENFDPLSFGQNGPKLVTRVWKQYHNMNSCERRYGPYQCADDRASRHSQINAMPQRGFYDVQWNEVHGFFGGVRSQASNKAHGLLEDLEMFRESHKEADQCSKNDVYGIHLWHSLIKGLLKYVAQDFDGTPIQRIFREYCPSTFKTMLAASKRRQGTAKPDRPYEFAVLFLTPFAGQQFAGAQNIEARTEIVAANGASGNHIASLPTGASLICFDELLSGPGERQMHLGCAKEGLPVHFEDFSPGHHVITAQLCIKHPGQEDGGCTRTGERGMTAFTVDFHVAWAVEVNKTLQ